MYDLNKCIEASINAGIEIMKIYNSENFQTQFKADNSPLTLADKNSNDIIINTLSEFNIPIISEEIKNEPYRIRKHWDFVWSIDPLDGTKEFLNKNGEFTVNIALIEKGKPILGIIYAPALKELYVGDVKNNQAYTQKNITCINDLLTINKTYLSPNKLTTDYIKVLLSKSHLSEETKNYINQLRVKHKIKTISKGSSLKLCLIADGKANIYPRFAATMEWDIAAGHAICNALGFKVINMHTQKELKYNKKKLLNPWFIINNIWQDQ